MLLSLLSLAFAQSPEAAIHAELVLQLDLARQDLTELRRLTHAPSSPVIQRRIDTKAGQIEHRLAILTQLTDQLGPVLTGPPPPPPGPLPCTPAELQAIFSAMKSEAFDDKRLARLRDALPNRAFTAGQARELMSTLTFGQGKVEAGVLLYPLVIDRENWFTVYDVFDFDTDKDKLRQRLGL